MKTNKLLWVLSMVMVLFFVNRQTNCQEPRWKWAKMASEANIIASETDTSGSVVAIGQFTGNAMSFENTTVAGSAVSDSNNMFVVKYNSSGNILWAQSVFGNDAGSQIIPVKVKVNDRGEIAIMCIVRNTLEVKVGRYLIPLANSFDKLIILKMARSGRILWVRRFETRGTGMNRISGTDMFLDNPGNVYCTGNFVGDSIVIGDDYIEGDNENPLLFVAKLNAFGVVGWIKSCDHDDTGEWSQITSRFMALSLDGILIGGDYQGKREYYFGADTLPQDTILSGFVAKMDFNGNSLWAQSINGDSSEFVDGIAADLAGNAYVTVLYNSPSVSLDTATLYNTSVNYDLFVAKLDPSGGLIWRRNVNSQLTFYDTPGRNSFFRVDLPGNVNLVTKYMGATVLNTGTVYPNAEPGTSDLLAVRLENSQGDIQWAHTGNSAGDDLLNDVTYDRYGSTYIMAVLNNSVTYGGTDIIDNTGTGGFYLVKINAAGQIRYANANLNTASGSLSGQRLTADRYGNVFLIGNFSGTGNVLGDLDMTSPETSGLFISKYSYTADISGTVYNRDGTPAEGGLVKLYGFTRFQRSPLSDSTLIGADGTYALTDVPYGIYIVYAYPQDLVSTLRVPTYHPNGSDWTEARAILITDSDPVTNIDIHLRQTPQALGTGQLGGMVYESDTTSVFKSSLNVQAKPLKKADVILIGHSKATDNVIGYTTTNEDGTFTFHNIPDGEYTIVVDIPGMPHESYYDVSVTGGSIIMNLDYLVGEETIIAENDIVTSIGEMEDDGQFSIYPNPCKGQLIIHAENGLSGLSQIQVFTLTGQCMFDQSVQMEDPVYLIDLAHLQRGVYLLKIQNGSEVFNQKLIME